MRDRVRETEGGREAGERDRDRDTEREKESGRFGQSSSREL